MAGAFDFKKEYRNLYSPPAAPGVVDVPEMLFIMVDGKGNPNTSEDYQSAVEMLYGLSYAVKMSKMRGAQPPGYFDYVVPPLEGLWWLSDGSLAWYEDKDKYCWTSMMRQPEFVDTAVFEAAKTELSKKKPHLDLSRARLEKLTEGLCVQAMHIGPYNDEPRTNAAIVQFMADNGYVSDISGTRRHHEIYLSDPRKTAPEKLKTVLRHPAASCGG
ncbi:MAG: GyrI-like domain-containing protein [Oscillospiraceae bacterium]|nr:GyrI-like domain-containing protein [Oscillospiraceae bacterium]